MTDDFDIGALLIAEAARRNAILDKTVFEQLDSAELHIEDIPNPTSYDLAENLMHYTYTFATSMWMLEHNREALVASCQRWLDARRSPGVA